MNKKIYFIRHAKSLGNVEWDLHQKDDSPLHISGKDEAIKVLKRIKKISFDLVISSDLKRCRETAEIIMGKNKKSIIYDELFREIGSDESFVNFKKRILNAKKYIESIDKEKILIVTHSQFMKMFLANILDPKLTENKYKKIHDFFRVVNTGISVFNCNSEGMFKGWQLRSWNEHGHLE
ncbi:histidine phosphatase family protein [Candidatus Parcubacteria bacterium]|nr:histidine phosphatase family protein [Candidatus Parcubacteria bacterium]